ncbi:DedA family protein, partial [Klebsiella pneumoniae]|nr:DedA family protein [Klebsiella pneumoniae]
QRGRLLWLSPLMVALAATELTFVFSHPLMPVYLAIMHKVIAR